MSCASRSTAHSMWTKPRLGSGLFSFVRVGPRRSRRSKRASSTSRRAHSRFANASSAHNHTGTERFGYFRTVLAGMGDASGVLPDFATQIPCRSRVHEVRWRNAAARGHAQTQERVMRVVASLAALFVLAGCVPDVGPNEEPLKQGELGLG